MPSYETVKNTSVAIWIRIRTHYSHPIRFFVSKTADTTGATTTTTSTPAYETPYVWSREFLEESGFNLSEKMPAILAVRQIPGVTYSDTFAAKRVVSSMPPSVILETLLNWLWGIVRTLVDTVCGLGLADLPWLFTVGVIIAVVYRWRSLIASILSSAWEELEEDVAIYVRRQFPLFRHELPPTRHELPPTRQELLPTRQEIPLVYKELPPGTTTISAEEMKAMHLSADAIQRRINRLRMSKFNFVRRRTGVIFNLNTFSKLQMQLTEAQEALKKEKIKGARPIMKFLRSRRTGVVVSLRTQRDLKLKQELDDLQAEFNVLEDSRDTWKEAFEALEEQAGVKEQADVKAVQDLRDQMASDAEHNGRRIEALQTQLGCETTNREEAQMIARDLRSSHTRLQGELREANTRSEDLESAYQELDAMHSAEESANEAKSQEIENLKAEIDRLQAALTDSNAPHHGPDTERDEAAATEPTEVQGESWQTYRFPFEQPQASRTAELAPLRRVQSASLWLPLPHHGDTFDHLYDVSDYGDNKEEDHTEKNSSHSVDDASVQIDGEGSSKGLEDQDENREGGSVGADHPPTSEASSHGSTFIMNVSAPDFVPSLIADAHEPNSVSVPAAASLGDPVEASSDYFGISDYDFNGSFSEDFELPDATPGLDFLLNMRIIGLEGDSFVEDPFHGEDPFPEIGVPEPTPAPRAAGPSQTRNPHIQKLNQEVKRLDWRRKSGLPDSAEEEEGVAGPSEVVDDMYHRQVSQSLSPSPNHFPRGSMWGALNDVPHALENLSLPSTPSSSTLGSHQTRRSEEQGTPVKVVRDEENAPQEGTGSGVLMLGRYEVTRGEPPASTDSGAPKEEDGGWSDFEGGDNEEDKVEDTKGKEDEKSEEDGVEAPKADENPSNNSHHSSPLPPPEQRNQPQQDSTSPIPVSQSPTLTHQPSSSASATNNASSQVTQGQVHAGPNAEAVQDRPAAGRPPSNYWAGIENAEMTHDEVVGDAISDALENLARKRPLRTLAQSRWAEKPATSTKTKAVPDKVPSPPVTQGQATNDRPHPEVARREQQPGPRRPSNFFPGSENATQTHDEEVGDALAQFVHERASSSKTLANSMWANNKSDTSSKSTTQQGSSKAAEGVASPRAPSQSGVGEVARIPLGPQGTLVERGLGSSGWSPRGNGRGRAGRSGHEPRFLPATTSSPDPIQTPPSQTPPSNDPLTGPRNQTPGTWNRKFGMFARGDSNDRRPDRSGPATPAPSTRGPASGSSTNESFLRWQEQIDRICAEDEDEDEDEEPPPSLSKTTTSSPAATTATRPANNDPLTRPNNRGTRFNPRGRGRGNDRHRPGRGGPYIVTPEMAAVVRGPNPSSATNESFLRWKERLAKAAEEEEKQQQE